MYHGNYRNPYPKNIVYIPGLSFTIETLSCRITWKIIRGKNIPDGLNLKQFKEEVTENKWREEQRSALLSDFNRDQRSVAGNYLE